MSVGTQKLTFYQGESISPRFTVTDSRVTDITGWTIGFVIKDTAADVDPPLHSASGSIVGGPPTLIVDVSTTLPLTLAPGTYVYSLRRTGVGTDWQLAHGVLEVVDSAHKDAA